MSTAIRARREPMLSVPPDRPEAILARFEAAKDKLLAMDQRRTTQPAIEAVIGQFQAARREADALILRANGVGALVGGKLLLNLYEASEGDLGGDVVVLDLAAFLVGARG